MLNNSACKLVTSTIIQNIVSAAGFKVKRHWMHRLVHHSQRSIYSPFNERHDAFEKPIFYYDNCEFIDSMDVKEDDGIERTSPKIS